MKEMKGREQEKLSVEEAVLRRYERGALQKEERLCCPTSQGSCQLDFLPQEIAEKDYGCGDPSAHVFEGERVLDLGSGAGKACYIIAQKVGEKGSVVGVDFNDAMLALARKYQAEIAARLGYSNVRFVKAKIQDLALDLDVVDQWLAQSPLRTSSDWIQFQSLLDKWRAEEPLIPSESIDVVVSSCVLNLVREEDKAKLFREMFRVLRRGGRAVISDIVCDEEPTEAMRQDPELWSGCIAGAFLEDRFLTMFEEAGFYGVELLQRAEHPWQTVEGIEFRAVTVRAFKGKDGPCLDRNQAVIYRGPWKAVHDDDGHKFPRGERIAVCDKTFQILTNPQGPYARDFYPVPPRIEIPLQEAAPFACNGTVRRDPKETKGVDYRETSSGEGSACGPGCC